MDLEAEKKRLGPLSDEPSIRALVEHALERIQQGQERVVNSDIGKLEAKGVIGIAKEVARLAHESNPDNIFFIVRYGTLLVKNDELNKAREFVDWYKSTHDEVTNVPFSVLDATIYKNERRYDEAIKILLTLNKPENERYRIREHLSESYYLSGNVLEAKSLLDGKTLNPDEQLVLAKIYFQENDIQRAYDVLKTNIGKHSKITAFANDFLNQALGDSIEPPNPTGILTKGAGESFSGVFIVHGSNEGVREMVARFIEKLGLPVKILHEQPNLGQTIIEKLLKTSEKVGYAVVLFTRDDRGGRYDQPFDEQRPRVRQNVLLELGLFVGSLGRERVCVLYEEGVEIPSDYSGVVYVPLDTRGTWKFLLAKEMKACELPIDMNKIY